MRLRYGIAGWLALVLCVVAMISTAVALGLHDRRLRLDLSRMTAEHLLQARVVTEHLLRHNMAASLRRYQASAQTPELRANLELAHAPSIAVYAERLASQHGALSLSFRRLGKRVATVGDSALEAAAIARLEEISASSEVCSIAKEVLCAGPSGDQLAFGLIYEERLFVVSSVALRSERRRQGQMVAVEEIPPAALAEWAALTLARIVVSRDEPPVEALSQVVRELGGGVLRVEVTGDAERRALGNARRNLLASGAIAVLLAIGASALLATALVQPIQRIGDASRRIHSGDLSIRLRSFRKDELGEVARAFDAMLDRLQEALEGLGRAQHLAQLGSWTLSLDTGAITYSDELKRMCGLDSDAVLDLGQLLEKCVHNDDRVRVKGALEQCISEGTAVRLDHRTASDDAPRIVHVQAERISTGGHPVRVEGTLQDVSERRLIEAQLRYLAERDSLTGLGNRRLFVEQLELTLDQARLEVRTVGVLLLGLDEFGAINDTLGASWGDRALQEIARRLAQVVTPDLSLARVGDDEFAVLVGDLRGPLEAARIARQVFAVLQAPVDLSGRQLVISASAGIALWPSDGADSETLLRSASAALHDAKEHGRATTRFYEESLNAVARKRLDLEQGMRRALENREFELHYQPILSLVEGRVAGLEALLRWRDPERGLVAPGEFIPVAEETGLIREVGSWVLRTAVADLRTWKEGTLSGLYVAINVSAAQLERSEFASYLEQVLIDAQVEPSRLVIEVTESLLPHDPEAASEILNRIANLGVRIALDDFGTGFSSLSALHQLPLHTVKLDRSFVASLETDRRSTQLVGAVVAMAQGLGLSVTVEGLESVGQLEIVRELGCDAVQGYLLSAAVESRDLKSTINQIETAGYKTT